MWWEHWFDNQTSAAIEGLVRQGLAILEDNGRLRISAVNPIRHYWLHITGSTDCRSCGFWDEIMFKRLNMIHSFCRYHCWKIVTRPRDVRELIQTHNLMYVIPFEYNFINPIPGKAGLDVREYTNERYGVFQYATSLIEALRIKEIMIHMITKYLPNEDIDGKHLQDTVIVKRACTEMEGKIPTDDPWWNALQTRDEWEIERRLEEIFMWDPDMGFQPAWLRDKVLQNWLSYANGIGDKSVADMIGADIFSVKSRTYKMKDLKGGETLTPQEREPLEEPTKQEANDGISNTKDQTA